MSLDIAAQLCSTSKLHAIYGHVSSYHLRFNRISCADSLVANLAYGRAHTHVMMCVDNRMALIISRSACHMGSYSLQPALRAADVDGEHCISSI